jgi:hypothetical protein
MIRFLEQNGKVNVKLEANRTQRVFQNSEKGNFVFPTHFGKGSSQK